MAARERPRDATAFEPFAPDPAPSLAVVPDSLGARQRVHAPDTWEVEEFDLTPTPHGARAAHTPDSDGRPPHGGELVPWPRATEPLQPLQPLQPLHTLDAMRARIVAELETTHRAELVAAERRGWEAGLSEGAAHAEAARAELRSLRDALEQALASLREHEQRFVGDLRANAVALAIAVARFLVEREVTTDASIVEDLVRRGLNEFPIDQPVRVRLHPADLELLLEVRSTAASGDDGDPWDPRRELSWLPDPLVVRGGAVLEGRERIVDGRVDTALERVFRRICSVA